MIPCKVKIHLVSVLLIVFCMGGCASIPVQKRLSELEAREAALSLQMQNQKEKMDQLKSLVQTSLPAVQKSVNESAAEIKTLRARLKDLQENDQKQQKEISALTARLSQREEEIKALSDRIGRLAIKINFLETYLGLSEKDYGEKGGWNGGAAERDTPKPLSDKYQLYTLAYDLFRDGMYAKARTEFQAFLRSFPNTEYSDNAQFWIGECYFFEGNYEQAIIEYDKVRKIYPHGDRVAPAILKKGFSLIGLGDKENGKAILQQVIKDYPKTYQARLAREKLLELK